MTNTHAPGAAAAATACQGAGIGEVMEQAVADYAVERRTRKGAGWQPYLQQPDALFECSSRNGFASGGEHGLRPVDANHFCRRISACEADRDVRGSAAEIEHRSACKLRKAAAKVGHEGVVGLTEVSRRVRGGLRGLVHQFRFG